MNIKKILYNIRKKGLANTYKIYKKKKQKEIIPEKPIISLEEKLETAINSIDDAISKAIALTDDVGEAGTKDRKLTILLLTNRDSDNIGDQVIEACDISLIATIMENLNIPKEKYVIKSKAAGIINQKYIETKNPELLKGAIETIKSSDIIFFGGAPLFNYAYQTFYERTAVTVKIAQRFNKPVIFSAIGVEGYDEKNPKCQLLKRTLNLDCVKQITTRDGYELLKQYKDNQKLVIDKVSDPAVYTKPVFKNYIADKTEKIGIFVFRAYGFMDNKIKFTKQQAADLWASFIKELEEKGYDYELLTSGHFGDEAFLDYLIREKGVNPDKCVLNMFTPETLIGKISSYKATVTCRLHPSIISFSLGVPSVSLIWNPKVTGFYNSINYPQRAISVEDITADKLMSALEAAIEDGVNADRDYLYTVYNSAFNAIKNIVNPNEDILPYNSEELSEKIVTYKGTSEKEYNAKIRRKLRRVYKAYNGLSGSLAKYKNSEK